MTHPYWHTIEDIKQLIDEGRLTPGAIASEVLQRMKQSDPAIWISQVDPGQLSARADYLDRLLTDHGTVCLSRYPLFGVPFAVKDNIDVAGIPTTAACLDRKEPAADTAFVVKLLLDAGAMLVGKTNLDQFATGLVGIRSPFGIPKNALDPQWLPGGSSSGSAVAVAKGLVCFALGTDTAGSGRVPAALNNIVGLKPSRGLISNRGLLPACKSLDCISVFALTVDDAALVTDILSQFDNDDPFARRAPEKPNPDVTPSPGFRFGIPQQALESFGDDDTDIAFHKAVQTMESLGGIRTEVDFTPFRQAAKLLYEGPWLAERYLSLQSQLDRHAKAVHPHVRKALEGAQRFTAMDGFKAYHRLKELRHQVKKVFQHLDCLLLPTIGRVFTLEDTFASPMMINSKLGYYTNFVNLLDLCALAVPAGLNHHKPFGVTLMAPAFNDAQLVAIGGAMQRRLALPLGATGQPYPDHSPPNHAAPPAQTMVKLCVSGAHMHGLPLNHQLLENQARFLNPVKTAPVYRLYALEHLSPVRPGMVRHPHGVALDIELWEMPKDRFGWFVASIPQPLGIGQVQLADGETVCGFLCEHYAVKEAKDISQFGGWRAYLAGSGR